MTSPLDRLADHLSPDMAAVNALILQHLGSEVPMAQDIAQNLIEAGGKRIRPLLGLAFGNIHGADMDKVRKLAAAIEFIHSATLLHDDVVDASDLRRGKPSANAVYGNAAPILVGDFLFARAFELVVQAENIPAFAILARTAGEIAQGEVLQLSVKGDLSVSRSTYDKIIAAKTAVLFAAATEIGAVLANAEGSAARAYGYHLGLAFQIMDDVLDYDAEQPKLGKTLGDDFREGKLTLPVWLALEKADDTERAFWQRTMGDRDQQENDLHKALDILRRHDSLTASKDVARMEADKARQALTRLPDHPLKADLADLLDFVLARAH